MKTIITVILGILFLTNPTILRANDEALYAAAPPSDASFVRFIGFETDEVVRFSGKDFTMKPGEEEAYVPVSSAQLEGVVEGAFYSLLKKADDAIITILEDPRDDPTKVILTLLNGYEQPLTLGVADGSMIVIPSTNASSSSQRAVNPIKIELGVFKEQGQKPIARFDVGLRRGQNITFFADASGVRIIEDRFGTNAE